MSSTALVLEGGGLRGVYTSGVLRAIHDMGLAFPYVIGTSMGACNAANFVSEQWERNRVVNIRFVRDRRYLSYRRLFLGGELFGMDFIYKTIPKQIVPFDFDRFFASPSRLIMSTTDVDSGECVYFDKKDLDREGLMAVMRASTSLPWIGNAVDFAGRRLMDGGLSDSIPLLKAMQDGNSRALVILTQTAGYRKSAARGGRWLGLKHPGMAGLVKCYMNRHEVYNQQLEDVSRAEQTGTAFVIRPSAVLDVGRVERNPEKLQRLYELGYNEMLARSSELHSWLSDQHSLKGQA